MRESERKRVCEKERLGVREREQGAGVGEETRKKGETDGELKVRQTMHSKRKEQRPK